MYRKTLYTLVILALALAGLLEAILPAVQAGPVGPAGQAAPVDPDCALLDDPEAVAMMSGISDWVLRYQCGRLEEPVPAPALQGSLPAMIPPAGVDVRVNAVDPPADNTIQSETTIAVSENTGTICAAFNDNYHFPDEGLAGFSRSTDGGATWEDGGSFPSGPGGVTWGDPSVAWRRADGYFYYTGLLDGIDGLGLWRSTDECASFQWRSFVYVGTQDDKEFMAIDNNPASPYYGRFYIAWTDLVSPRRISLVYSDDGANWTGPFTLSTPGEMSFGAWPAVAPNGDLYVVWLLWVVYDTTISVEGVRSTDGGNTFTPMANPLSDAVAPRDAQATINCNFPALKANASDGIRYFAMPQVAVGPDGCLHVVYSYDPDGYDVGDVVDSYYRRSCDNGVSWEPEVRLNDDDTLTDQYSPAVAVNQDNIVIASWYDRRDDPQNNYLFGRYWTLSYDGGTIWEPNQQVSDFPSAVYAASNCYHGDYDQLATYGNNIYHIWSDDRIFFNGHWDPDVWFDRAFIVPDFTIGAEPAAHDLCRPATVTLTIELGSIGGYDQPVTLSDSGVPAGVQTAFSFNPVTPPGTSTYLITVTAGALAGNYDLVVAGQSPTLTRELTITLAISDCCAPVMVTAFNWLPLTPTVGEVVTFTARASGTEPISYSWGLGVGELGIGAEITHVYIVAGEYGVTLTATNGCGQEVVAHMVTVVPYCEPVHSADFSWEPYTPTASQVVTFTGSASGTAPLDFDWDWGDGMTGTGALATHVFTPTGGYTVTLVASNGCGEETVQRTITVLAGPPQTWPVYLPIVSKGYGP